MLIIKKIRAREPGQPAVGPNRRTEEQGMQALKKWLAVLLAGSIALCGAAAVSAEPATRLGDVNNDGYINNKDLSRMKQYLADDLTQIVFDATDMTRDGYINNKDYARLKKYLADPDILRNGWIEEDGNTYYYVDDIALTGHQLIDGVRYKFNDSGVLTSFVGIDVSGFQGEIDWEAVKADGVDYVMIRSGYRGDTSGNLFEDSYFEQNLRGAYAAGLECGVYFFSQAVTVEEAEQEADFVLELLQKVPECRLSYPVAYDMEASADPDARTADPSITNQLRTDMASAFCNKIKDAGYITCIYSNKNWFEEKLDLQTLRNRYDLWVAHWTQEVTPFTPFTQWQYTSEGSVAGINGAVDRNICTFDYARHQTDSITYHEWSPIY